MAQNNNMTDFETGMRRVFPAIFRESEARDAQDRAIDEYHNGWEDGAKDAVDHKDFVVSAQDSDAYKKGYYAGYEHVMTDDGRM